VKEHKYERIYRQINLKGRTFGPERDEVMGDWRKLHNEELHNLHSLPNIIRMIKSRRMRWARYVVQWGRRGIHVGYWFNTVMNLQVP
jgi:hypothetical protein